MIITRPNGPETPPRRRVFGSSTGPALLALLIAICMLPSLLLAQTPPSGSGDTTGAADTTGTATAPDTATPPPSGTQTPVVINNNNQQPPSTTTAQPATQTPVTPLYFRSLRAAGNQSRGVMAGGTVALVLNRAPTTDAPVVIIKGIVGDSAVAVQGQRLLVRDVTDSIIMVDVPSDLPRGEYEVKVLMAGSDSTQQPIVLQRPHILNVESFPRVLLISLVPLVLLALIIWGVSRRYVPPMGARNLNLAEMLLLEPKNMTYSLSRAQFILWTAAISAAYVFIFVARGIVESIWEFPPLSGFIWTFLISLGTLLAAEATSSVKGVKGAGEIHPSSADLFVHGGVIALERVQQALWTLIGVGMFLYIVVKNYAESTQLPVVPEQLLYLMGISSAGYLTGKAIRNPGPIISDVQPLPNATTLSVIGTNISNNALVWIDGTKLDATATPVVPDASKPNEFARAIQVPFLPSVTSTDQWYGSPRTVTVVNADGQRAEWHSGPKILTVTTAPGQAANTTQITVTGEYIGQGMSWQVTGVPAGPAPTATQSPAAANQWLLTVPDTGQPKKFDTITVRDSSGRFCTYTWQ